MTPQEQARQKLIELGLLKNVGRPPRDDTKNSLSVIKDVVREHEGRYVPEKAPEGAPTMELAKEADPTPQVVLQKNALATIAKDHLAEARAKVAELRAENPAAFKKKHERYDDSGELVSKKERKRIIAIEALRLRLLGLSWRQVSEQLGFSSSSAALKAARRLESEVELDTVEELRQRQLERLDLMFGNLVPGMLKGSARSIEVGVKILERESRLMALDKVDAKQSGESAKPISINIIAHPRDAEAIELAREHGLPALPGEVLQTPIDGSFVEQEGDSPGGGDG
jgi:hypothetical protein